MWSYWIFFPCGLQVSITNSLQGITLISTYRKIYNLKKIIWKKYESNWKKYYRNLKLFYTYFLGVTFGLTLQIIQEMKKQCLWHTQSNTNSKLLPCYEPYWLVHIFCKFIAYMNIMQSRQQIKGREGSAVWGLKAFALTATTHCVLAENSEQILRLWLLSLIPGHVH